MIFTAVPSKRVRVVPSHANLYLVELTSRHGISIPSVRTPATTVKLTTWYLREGVFVCGQRKAGQGRSVDLGKSCVCWSKDGMTNAHRVSAEGSDELSNIEQRHEVCVVP